MSAEGGNGSTHRQALTLRGEAGKLGYSLSAARIESEGFRKVNDDYRNLSTSGRLDLQATEDASLKGIFRFFNTDLGLFNNNNFVPARDPNAREASTQYLGKLEWQQRIIKTGITAFQDRFLRNTSKIATMSTLAIVFRLSMRLADPQTAFDRRSAAAEFQTNYRFEDWSTTTFGVEYKRRKAETSGGIDKAIRNLGYYLEEQLQFLDRRLIMIPGIRVDENQSFGTAFTPAFSAAYLFREIGTKLKGGYAKGSRRRP